MKIVLPFPSSLLAGHAKGNDQWEKVKVTKEHRALAKMETLVVRGSARPKFEGKADIPITIRFIPGDNRGDRMNFPARMKPYVDGIAEALGVNDRRFHPCFIYCEPEKPGRVEVYIGAGARAYPLSTGGQPSGDSASVVNKKTADASATNPRTRHNHNAETERQA